MKKWLIISMALVLGLLLSACSPQPIKTIGATKYYVEVQNDGDKYTAQDQTRYKYELKGFNKDGESKTLSFTANHQLKQNAYLQVHYKKGEVITYEEVEWDDIPNKAQQLLNDNHNS